ncbi:hypothetical protein ACJIZ3_002331 [Penstemon smallii]|uniref:Uncharacterized protein n=1 Tax=Penstemon smallii TaxID=265156 RepID=A0ABD3U8Q0_9LAMI
MENKPLGVRKGTWTKEEDFLLKQCVDKYGEGKWHLVPLRAGLNRCRKSCRLRWLNYLRPDIKRGCFTKDEVDLIIRLHKLLGNKWSLIAGRLPGRTANDVKNFWNTHIEKKLAVIGERTRKDVQNNNITERKIIKPRPRTFSKLHTTCPNETKEATNFPNFWNTLIEKKLAIIGERTRKDVQKINITETKIIKPRPRTFSKLHITCPNGTKEATPSNNATLTCTSKEEPNEYIKWWSELLEATENGESSGNLFPEDNQTGESSSALHDVDNYTTPSAHHLFSFFDHDVNVWENLSLDDK